MARLKAPTRDLQAIQGSSDLVRNICISWGAPPAIQIPHMCAVRHRLNQLLQQEEGFPLLLTGDHGLSNDQPAQISLPVAARNIPLPAPSMFLMDLSGAHDRASMQRDAANKAVLLEIGCAYESYTCPSYHTMTRAAWVTYHVEAASVLCPTSCSPAKGDEASLKKLLAGLRSSNGDQGPPDSHPQLQLVFVCDQLAQHWPGDLSTLACFRAQ